MNDKTIIHIDAGRRPGGGQRQAARLISGLTRSGWRCLLLCPPESPFGDMKANTQLLNDAELQALPLTSSWDVRSAWRLKGLAATADLLHAHDARSHSIARIAQTLGLQIPLVVHRRVFFPIKNSLLRDWKYGHGVDAYIAVSEPVRGRLRAAGVDPDIVNVVPSCVDLERFSGYCPDPEGVHEELGISPDSRLVLNVGRLTSEKMQKTLIDAFGLMIPEYPNMVLVLAGDGPLRNELEDYALKCLGAGRCFILGQREDIPRLLRAADLFVLASSEEGMPMALFEAMAAGVPAVSTACGGVNPYAGDDVIAPLVPPGNAQALAEAMKALLKNPQADRIERARRMVHEKLSPENMVSGVLRVYEKVLSLPK